MSQKKWTDKNVERHLRDVYKNVLWYAGYYPRVDENFYYLAIFQLIIYTIIHSLVFLLMALSFFSSIHLMLFAMKFLRMLCHTLISQLTIGSLYTKRDLATFLFKTKIENFFDYNEPERHEITILKQNRAKRLKKAIWLLPFYGVILISNMFVVPFIEKYYGGDQLPGDVFDNSLFFAMWSPDPESISVRIVLSLVFLLFMFIDLCVTSGGVSLFYDLFESLLEQLKILNISMENLEERAKKHSEQNITKYENSLDFCLKQNIQHLIILRRFKDNLERYCSVPIISIFILSAVFLACAAILLLKSEGNPFRIYTGVTSLITEIYVIGIFNGYGQTLIDESEKLRSIIYAVNWLNFDKKNRKTINMMQLMTTENMSLKAGGLATLNMLTLRQVINSAYSFINLFLAVN